MELLGKRLAAGWFLGSGSFEPTVSGYLEESCLHIVLTGLASAASLAVGTISHSESKDKSTVWLKNLSLSFFKLGNYRFGTSIISLMHKSVFPPLPWFSASKGCILESGQPPAPTSSPFTPWGWWQLAMEADRRSPFARG